jgi:3-methyladenine DNA glycosylase AlkD
MEMPMAGDHLTASEAQEWLRGIGSPEVAAISARFFKTGPGQYGEGDVFIGVRVPMIRKVARDFKTLPLSQVKVLLHSDVHEERLLALVVMVLQFEKGDSRTRKRVYDLYFANTEHINNWDLVDLSAPHIVGRYLNSKSRRPLYRLARSSSLWERRVAILATYHFIRQHDFDDTLKIAKMLLHDKEDLIHKAVGWMLREIGNRDLEVEENFLADHGGDMPRTMLRYAIERFPKRKRQEYLGVRGSRKS